MPLAIWLAQCVNKVTQMTRDDIKRMAQKAGLTINGEPMSGVEHFAYLVAEQTFQEARQIVRGVNERNIRGSLEEGNREAQAATT